MVGVLVVFWKGKPSLTIRRIIDRQFAGFDGGVRVVVGRRWFYLSTLPIDVLNVRLPLRILYGMSDDDLEDLFHHLGEAAKKIRDYQKGMKQ